MTDQQRDPESDVFRSPDYNVRFVLGVVLLGLITLGLQAGLFLWMPEEFLSNLHTSLPIAKAVAGLRSTANTSPGMSAIWQKELWVSVVSGTPTIPGTGGNRASTSRLIAIDLNSRVPRETDITLSPEPIGILEFDDQLWAVAENVVYRIQIGQAVPRYPRRGLIQPTKPFVYEGQLAVIDKNKNDVFTLLTWNDGEWTEIAKVEAPETTTATPWYTPELRVLSNGKTHFLFYADGQSIWFREGIELISDSDPVSALRPENKVETPLALQQTKAPRYAQFPARQLAGWKTIPVASNWQSSWDAAVINDEVWVFSNNYNTSSGIQQFKYTTGMWVGKNLSRPIRTTSFSAVSSPDGYLLTDNLRVFAVDGSVMSQELNAKVHLVERFRFAICILTIAIWHSLAMVVLAVGTSMLMRTCRNPQYKYGKREVILASVLRRGVARSIDTLATAFPPIFWFATAMYTSSGVNWTYGSTGRDDLLLFTLFSIFGMWIGGIIAISYTEGRWGMTPGKWICGIRTFRTTLRPCGFLRAFAREFLIYIDGLFLITWLPGVLSIAFTKDWQRLGDLAAETLVVLDPKRSWSSTFYPGSNSD